MIRERYPLRVAYNTDGDDVTMTAITRAPAAGATWTERISTLQRRLLRRLLQDEALRDHARELLARYPMPEPTLSAEDALNRAMVEDDIVRAEAPDLRTVAGGGSLVLEVGKTYRTRWGDTARVKRVFGLDAGNTWPFEGRLERTGKCFTWAPTGRWGGACDEGLDLVELIPDAAPEKPWVPDNGLEWIEYDGSGRPVPPDTVVEVLTLWERQNKHFDSEPRPALVFEWQDFLVAYAIVPQPKPEKPWVPEDGRPWHELDDVRSWPHLHALLKVRVRYLRAEDRECRGRPSTFTLSLALALERRDVVAVSFTRP